MSDELFPPESVAVLSPRLQWLEAHSVHYSRRPNCFTAWAASAPMQCFTAFDLDDALAQLAAKNGWRLWNEEGA